MTIRKQPIRVVLILTSFALGLIATRSVRADHDYDILRARADAVYHTMVDLDRTLVDSFHHSRVFGDIMATSARIKSRALYLRGMAWNGSSCSWVNELQQLDNELHRLQELMNTAYFRAQRGWDPPISWCSTRAARTIDGLIALVHDMQNALVVVPVVPPPVYRPDCGYPGYSGGCYSGSYYKGNGAVRIQPANGGLTIGNNGFGLNIRF